MPRWIRGRVAGLADRLLERLILALQGKGPFDGQQVPVRPRPLAPGIVERPRALAVQPREPIRRLRPMGKRRQAAIFDRRRAGTHRSGRHL
jgi:hypothetical protein